jgi:hypothetical protein
VRRYSVLPFYRQLQGRHDLGKSPLRERFGPVSGAKQCQYFGDLRPRTVFIGEPEICWLLLHGPQLIPQVNHGLLAHLDETSSGPVEI